MLEIKVKVTESLQLKQQTYYRDEKTKVRRKYFIIPIKYQNNDITIDKEFHEHLL